MSSLRQYPATRQGSFDECTLVQAPAGPCLAERYSLTVANSINLGRLLPQYYSLAACNIDPEIIKTVEFLSVRKLGNAFAAVLAPLPAHDWRDVFHDATQLYRIFRAGNTTHTYRHMAIDDAELGNLDAASCTRKKKP